MSQQIKLISLFTTIWQFPECLPKRYHPGLLSFFNAFFTKKKLVWQRLPALSAKSSPPFKLPSNEYNIFLPWVQKRGGEKRDQTKPANTFTKVGYIQQTKICVCLRQMLYVSGVRRIQNWVFLFLEARRENITNRHPSPPKNVKIQ